MKKKSINKKYKKWIIVIALLPIAFSIFTQNPRSTNIKSKYYPVSQLEFLSDLTFERDGQTIHEQSIHEAELQMIAEAEDFILLDLFLFNDLYDKSKGGYPDSSGELASALIAKKTALPDINIVFITDPINNFYGAYEQKYFTDMKAAGINVIETDLDKLKDSNFLYSGYYRLLVAPFGQSGKGFISNPLDKTSPDINIRSILKLANFKANHRKLIVTEKEALIATANPHNASSYHSNAAVRFSGPVMQDIMFGERVTVPSPNSTLPNLRYKPSSAVLPNTQVRYLTEKAIFDALIEAIGESAAGDKIQIGIFYISDFDTVDALEQAAKRGVSIKIIADPNKDAFGIEKDGSPNRTVLSQLVSKSDNIQVRWYDTDGEQYHTKLAFFTYPNNCKTIIGSGNYTRRNIKGYNLESDLEIISPKNSPFSLQLETYFHRLWSNIDGNYTLDFDEYSESSFIKRLLYLIQESSGLSTY